MAFGVNSGPLGEARGRHFGLLAIIDDQYLIGVHIICEEITQIFFMSLTGEDIQQTELLMEKH